MQVNCCPSQVKANRSWLWRSTGVLQKALQRSVTVRNLLSMGMEVRGVWGSGTKRCQGMTILWIALRSCTTLHPRPWGFFTGMMGVLRGLEQGTKRPRILYSSMIGFTPARDPGFKRSCLMFGRGLLGSAWIFTQELSESSRYLLWILPKAFQGLPPRAPGSQSCYSLFEDDKLLGVLRSS